MIRKFALGFVLVLALNSGIAGAADRALCPNCPPEDPRGDVFDANVCVGPTMTSEDAARKFCAGASSVELADFKYVLRARTCNKYTKCGNWAYINIEKHLVNQSGNTNDFTFGDQTFRGGKLALQTLSDGVRVNFVSAAFSSRSTGVFNFYTASVLPARVQSTFVDSDLGSNLVPYGTLRLTGANGATSYADRVMLKMNGIQFTDHCARFLASAQTSPDSAASWVEYQLGGLATYSPNFRALHRRR